MFAECGISQVFKYRVRQYLLKIAENVSLQILGCFKMAEMLTGLKDKTVVRFVKNKTKSV